MLDLFNTSEMMMLGLVLFSSFWIFLFNYRNDNKDKYSGHGWLILLDLVINMGMSATRLYLQMFHNLQPMKVTVILSVIFLD